MERKLRVYVDDRERASGVPQLLAKLGVAVLYRKLSVCDYVVPGGIGIERKTVVDLVKSVFDGRLLDQVRRMAETYEVPVLIIEGLEPIERYTSRANAIRGAIATAIVDFGLRLMRTVNERETACMIYSLARRGVSARSRGPIVLHKKPKLGDLRSWQLYVVQSLPHVGPKLAQRLLETFGTVERVFTASAAELSRVEGLGYERAINIVRILKTPYRPMVGREREFSNIEDFIERDE